MISPHAIIDPKAQLAADVDVGPFCVVGPDVVLGPGCKLVSHVSITGHVSAGASNVFYPGVVVGQPPQDRKYRGAATRIEIGSNNTFREHVTVHIGTERGGGLTRVGDGNYLMINVHLGHDAQLGSHCTFANNVMIAGHVIVGDFCNLMGGVGVHHFVSIGKCCFVGGYARVHHDAPPFCKIDGADEIRGLNIKGLRMAGYKDADIEALEDAYKRLFDRKGKAPFASALADFDTENGLNPHVKHMVDFLRLRDMGKHGRYLQGHRAAR